MMTRTKKAGPKQARRARRRNPERAIDSASASDSCSDDASRRLPSQRLPAIAAAMARIFVAFHLVCGYSVGAILVWNPRMNSDDTSRAGVRAGPFLLPRSHASGGECRTCAGIEPFVRAWFTNIERPARGFGPHPAAH